MERPSEISACTEPGIAVDLVKHQNTEVIKSVANKLAIIGDELSLSYQGLSYSASQKVQVMRHVGKLLGHFVFGAAGLKLKV